MSPARTKMAAKTGKSKRLVKTKTKRNDEDDESSGGETGARRSASIVPRNENENEEPGETGQEPAVSDEATRARPAVVDTPSAEESPASRPTHPPMNEVPSESLSSPATEKTAEMHATSALYQLTTMVASLQSSAVETRDEMRNETMNELRNETRNEMRNEMMNDERDDEAAPTSLVDAQGDDESVAAPTREATADGQPFSARTTPTDTAPADPEVTLNAGTTMTGGANGGDLQTITTVLRGLVGQLVGLCEVVTSAVTAERVPTMNQAVAVAATRSSTTTMPPAQATTAGDGDGHERRGRNQREAMVVVARPRTTVGVVAVDERSDGGRRWRDLSRRTTAAAARTTRRAKTVSRGVGDAGPTAAASPKAAPASRPARTTMGTAEESDDEDTGVTDDGDGNANASDDARMTGSDQSDSHDARASRTLNCRRSRPHRRLPETKRTWTNLKKALLRRYGEKLDKSAAEWRVSMRRMMPDKTTKKLVKQSPKPRTLEEAVD
ncbi:hypothetical protein PR003_g8441 [Phytophthora rubi]|uniref:Uncharacterized protein n=1 Tax=Phytophthora rubi TaxID=129364 RepID=A0A6A4FB63_9STRA|nr:hypothetical protein PR003_g8441 [Phytophthora rubi]